MQYELALYEIGGNESVDLIDPRQVSDADAIVLVFSLASPDAIQQLRFYQARLAQIVPEVPMFLAGVTSVAGGLEEEQLLAVNIEEIARHWGISGFWKTTVQAGLSAQAILASLISLPRSAGKTVLKIVFMGPPGGGKSALIARLANAELTGVYEPTARSRVITIQVEALAPIAPPLATEPKQEESIPMGDNAQVAFHQGDSLQTPPNLSQEVDSLDIDHKLPPEASTKAPTSPPGGAIPPPEQNLRGAMNQELKGLLAKTRPTPDVGETPPPPGRPTTPSPVVAGKIAHAPPSGPVTPPPVAGGQSVPAPPAAGAMPTLPAGTPVNEPLPPMPPTEGSGDFTRELNEEEPTSPTLDLKTPPSPPTPMPSKEEAGSRVSRDEGRRKYRETPKEMAKAEKKAKQKAESLDDETFSPEMEKAAERQRGMAGPARESTVTVEKVLERKTTVFYRKQMNPLTRNKLSVVLSTLKIYEQLKLQMVVPAERVGGQQTLKIRELSPFVYVEPVFPGCICVPAQAPLDARRDSDTADFHITPLATGEVMDACVRIYYEGKLVDTIQTPTKIVNQTSAKVSAAAAVILPVIGPNIDTLLSSIPFIGGLWAMVGGIENLFMYVAGALGVLGTIMYLINRPRQAIPIEANFPELQKFLEEDVNRPGLGEVLKEKAAQERVEEEQMNKP